MLDMSRSCWQHPSWLRGPGSRQGVRATMTSRKREVHHPLVDFAAVWNELFPVEQARIVLFLVRAGGCPGDRPQGTDRG